MLISFFGCISHINQLKQEQPAYQGCWQCPTSKSAFLFCLPIQLAAKPRAIPDGLLDVSLRREYRGVEFAKRVKRAEVAWAPSPMLS